MFELTFCQLENGTIYVCVCVLCFVFCCYLFVCFVLRGRLAVTKQEYMIYQKV